MQAILAQLNDVNSVNYRYASNTLFDSIDEIVEELFDDEPEAEHAMASEITDFMYKNHAVKAAEPGQDGDYVMTFKNVRAQVLEILDDFGLRPVKNVNTNTESNLSDKFEQICSITIPLFI